jgi:hypothetical protein
MVVIVMRDSFNDGNTTSSSSSSSSSSCCSPRSELSEPARSSVIDAAQLTDALAASIPQRQQKVTSVSPAAVAQRTPAPNTATSKPLSTLIEGLTQRSATPTHSASAVSAKGRNRLAATVPGPSRPAVGATAKAAGRATSAVGTRERVLTSDVTATTSAVTPVSAADSSGDDTLGFTKSSTATTGDYILA